MKIYFNLIFFNSTNATYSYLTNLEVMQLLVKIKSTKKKFGMRNLATVTYEVSKSYIRKLTISKLTKDPSIWQALQYLEESPCKTQTRESINGYLRDLAAYRLMPHEMLQMVNDPPTSALHTQLVRRLS